MMMAEHELKSWPEHFEDVARGEKRFELRWNDRDFKRGDILFLREWQRGGTDEVVGAGKYTGRELRVIVTFIIRAGEDEPTYDALSKGWIVMSFKPFINSIGMSVQSGTSNVKVKEPSV
mgnify:CR=1 FL=1